MSLKTGYYFLSSLSLLFLLCSSNSLNAQTTLPIAPQKDTAHNKSNTNTWKDEESVITYEHPDDAKLYKPDTNLHTFHRRPFVQSWYRDLGNPGSPVYNLLFTPDNNFGPALGYHNNDVYRFNPDSLNYYNTTRPYSVFNYQLGSKLEQVAGLLHTQNIKPNWNFMVEYRKINAPGFYKIQRNNHDNFCLTTNYKSISKRYTLYAAMVYNKEQHDENGGIVNDSALNDIAYIDRRTVDVAYQNSQYSNTRSTVTNVQRDFGLLLQHAYTWGPVDTTYNADSTEYAAHLKPRFSITHKMELSTEKHTYKDLAPDSTRYVYLFTASFPKSSTSYYTQGEDSVMTQQQWFWADNKLLLNGFWGKADQQLQFSAGIGNRYDQFTSDPTIYNHTDQSKTVSNYLTASIKKEAVKTGEWAYRANASLFLTGDYAGNVDMMATIGKEFNNNKGGFNTGFRQQLGNAPYSCAIYKNAYTNNSYTYNKESITTFLATLDSKPLKLSGGLRNYTINNYYYLNEQQTPSQYTIPFNLTQIWGRKLWKLGRFCFDNEVVVQQATGNAPVNIPVFMGRHQLSYEHNGMFQHKLKIVTGIEVRENSFYAPAGYSAVLNRFYNQQKNYANNPEVAFVLNFALKHFRAFIMADQLQQLLYKNTILFTGSPIAGFNGNATPYIPVYAAQNTTIRFGFSWILIN